ncbi:hypothetical protein HK098_003959 [Nowakowskiella sp. JEL0407]|nr:hypothetical protein HK098_003959 [Nowakowskiella sp. JEL0407]
MDDYDSLLLAETLDTHFSLITTPSLHKDDSCSDSDTVPTADSTLPPTQMSPSPLSQSEQTQIVSKKEPGEYNDSSDNESVAASDIALSSSSSEDDDPSKPISIKQRNKILTQLDNEEDDDDIDLDTKPLEPIKSKNELSHLPPVEPIDVEIPAHLPLCEIGEIYAIVSELVIVQSNLKDKPVLDAESVLLFEDRSVLGKVFDTFGPVTCPHYSVRFNNEEEIKKLDIELQKKVYFIPDLATFVFTQLLLNQKGSDASNLYDEEVGDDEKEFSDDEQELEHKRQVKHARRKQLNPDDQDEQPPQRNKNNRRNDRSSRGRGDSSFRGRGESRRGDYRGPNRFDSRNNHRYGNNNRDDYDSRDYQTSRPRDHQPPPSLSNQSMYQQQPTYPAVPQLQQLTGYPGIQQQQFNGFYNNQPSQPTQQIPGYNNPQQQFQQIPGFTNQQQPQQQIQNYYSNPVPQLPQPQFNIQQQPQFNVPQQPYNLTQYSTQQPQNQNLLQQYLQLPFSQLAQQFSIPPVRLAGTNVYMNLPTSGGISLPVGMNGGLSGVGNFVNQGVGSGGGGMNQDGNHGAAGNGAGGFGGGSGQAEF